MKVTKNGVTFTNDEMRDFVFPVIILGLSKQLDNMYDKDAPKKVTKMLREGMEEFLLYAKELSEKTGVRMLEKKKNGRFDLTWYSQDWPKKFNRFPDGIVKTDEIPIKNRLPSQQV